MKVNTRIPVAVLALVTGVLLTAGCSSQTSRSAGDAEPEPYIEDSRRGTEPGEPSGGRDQGRVDIQNLSLSQLNRMGLLQDIRFDFNKHNLKPESVQTLRGNADFMREYPTVKVLIEGHCDERGTNEYNLALGDRRANTAREYLLRVGVESRRLTTISYGEERPLDSRGNEQAWAKNRRAHFRIVAK